MKLLIIEDDPVLLVMAVYTGLYSIVALMSLGYYRKVGRNSL